MFQEEPKTSKNSVFLIFLFLVCSESWIDGVCAALAVSVGGVMVMVKAARQHCQWCHTALATVNKCMGLPILAGGT